MSRRTNLISSRAATLFLLLCTALLAATSLYAAVGFTKGDSVRLTRSETLLFKGQNFLGAPKGQEFTVLQYDLRQGLVYVPFFKEDGSLIAVTLPADALELTPPDPWKDLLGGVEAFRDQRYDDARRLLLNASRSADYRPLASAITPRVNGAIAAAGQARGAQAGSAPTAALAFSNTLQALRDVADQLGKLGYLSLALALDEGTDRLAAQVPAGPQAKYPASKLNREDLFKRVADSNRAVVRARQAIALHRLVEASKYLGEGLEVEPTRPELKLMQTKVQKDLAEADSQFKAADSMRRFEKGAVHALTALERGLKLCVDHPQLIGLKKEMQGAFEEQTAPPVTPAFLTAAGTGVSAQLLEEGRKLYTSRCTECHDLELLDSRSMTGWRTAVSGMARRAHIGEEQQARIIEYLAAAQNGMK